MAITLQEGLQGLGLLGSILALPRTAQYGQQQALQQRSLMEGLFTPEQIQAAAPDAPLQWLSADRPGIGGKILGGVGDVGSILSSVLGRPIGPPRTTVAELAQIRNAQIDKQKRDAQARAATIIGDKTKSPEEKAQALAEAGAFDAAGRILNPEVKYSPSERVTQTAEAGRADREAQRAGLLASGRNPQDVDVWVRTGSWPAQGRETPAEAQQRIENTARTADKVEQERRQRLVDAHPEWTQPQKDHVMVNGSLPAEARPDQETSPDWFFQQSYQAFVNQNFRQPTEQELAVINAQATAAYTAYVQSRRALTPGPPGTPKPETPVKAEEQPGAAPGAGKRPTPGEAGTNQLPGAGGANAAPQTPTTPGPVVVTTTPSETNGAVTTTQGQIDTARAQARAQVIQMLEAGLTPLGVSTNRPDVWAAAGLTGSEGMERGELWKTLQPPSEVPAGDQAAAQAQATQGPQTPGALANTPVDPSKLSSEGQAQLRELQTLQQSGKISTEEARRRYLQLR
jgi:hypothetical protein